MEQINLNAIDVFNLIKNGSVTIYNENVQNQVIIKNNDWFITDFTFNKSGTLQDYRNYPSILTKNNLCELFQFGKTKMDNILNANILPVVQIGKDYRVTSKQIEEWFKKNSGKRILL